MSVTFYLTDGVKYFTPEPEEELYINLANTNAGDVLDWLGLGLQLWDEDPYPLSDFAARCRRRLWPENHNNDPALPAEEDGNHIFLGRRAGYLKEKTGLLLKLCEHGQQEGFTHIYWG